MDSSTLANVTTFGDGVTPIADKDFTEVFLVRYKDRWDLVDSLGKTIITNAPNLAQREPLGNGYLCTSRGEGRTMRLGALHVQKGLIIDPIYKGISMLPTLPSNSNKSFFQVSIGDKHGLINEDGTHAIEVVFDRLVIDAKVGIAAELKEHPSTIHPTWSKLIKLLDWEQAGRPYNGLTLFFDERFQVVFRSDYFALKQYSWLGSLLCGVLSMIILFANFRRRAMA